MASDVLVSDTIAGSGNDSQFDDMTAQNGTADQPVEADLMGSANQANGDSTEQAVTPSKAKNKKKNKKKGRTSNGSAQNGDTNGHANGHSNGHANGAANGHHDEEQDSTPQETPLEEEKPLVVEEPAQAEEPQQQQVEEAEEAKPEDEAQVVAEDAAEVPEIKHTETVVTSSEDKTTEEGDVIHTESTTIIKVDESAEGETQVITTTVKTTTVSYHSSEVVIEVPQGVDIEAIQPHELAAIVEQSEPAEKTEDAAAAVGEEKPAAEPVEGAGDASAAASVSKEAKQSTARRLFDRLRSPSKQKSVDDPTQAAASDAKAKEKAEKDVKSPNQGRKLFGWRKTWTPEKSKAEETAKPAGEEGNAAEKLQAEGCAEEAPEKAATLPPKGDKKKAKKAKKDETKQQENADDTANTSTVSVEEKVVSPSKKPRFGFMKKSKSSHATASPSKASTAAEKSDEVKEADKSITEKWQAEGCAESEHAHQPAKVETEDKENEPAERSVDEEAPKMETDESTSKPTEEALNETAAEKWAAETCTERPASPKKEEEKAAEADGASEPKKQKTEKSKTSVRKSWTFRMNRSQTEDKDVGSPSKKANTLGGTHKEAPPALHPQEKPAAFSPGKPFFSGLLHRKKKTPDSGKSAAAEHEPAKEAEQVQKLDDSLLATQPIAEEVTASKVAESMSMPQLTPSKHNQSASEKWAAEGCPGEPATSHQDVVVDLKEEPLSQSTAVKGVEGSPMRRSASLRMPSSLSRFFRFLGPRQRTTTVAGGLSEETAAGEAPTTPPRDAAEHQAPHTTSLTTPVSPRSRSKDAPSTDSKPGDQMTPSRSGFRFWSTWRSSGGPGTFGRFRRKDKNMTIDGAQTSHDDTSLIVNTSLGPAKSATMHDVPKADTAPSVDLGAILARLPPHSPNDHSPTYIGISRVLNGYAEYNSPTKARSGASSQASHKSPGGTVTATLEVPEGGIEGGSLLQTVTMAQKTTISTNDIGRDAAACLATADAEQARLESRCDHVRPYLDAPELTAEARGQIEATLGKTNLLLTQKFKQFRDLCHEATKPAVEGSPHPPNATDLAGFWDLVLIQVNDLDKSFEAIESMKTNNWQKAAEKPTENGAPAEQNGKDKKKDKKKAEAKAKAKKPEGEEAEAKAKSRFAEFKQRMFKGGKDKSVDKSAAAVESPASGSENTAPQHVNGTSNGTVSESESTSTSASVPAVEQPPQPQAVEAK